MDKNYIIQVFVAILASIVIGKFYIPFLRKQNVGQNVSDWGPEDHLEKQGTPTMGGVIIALSLLIAMVFARNWGYQTMFLIIASFGFGGIGFIDDFLMLIMKKAVGLTAKQKIVLQIALGILLSLILKSKFPQLFGNFAIPFTDQVLNLGFFSHFVYVFVMVGAVNAVNLTDGLDGLLSFVTIPVLILLAYIGKSQEIHSFALILLGAIIGFLVYNSNPATIFMGDTGSMFIGGAVAGLAIMTGTVLYLAIYGIIYVIEAGSVIIQVISYKTRNKKRVFLMTPIHHHYELKGYPEQKIVVAFTVVSLLFSIIALVGMGGI